MTKAETKITRKEARALLKVGTKIRVEAKWFDKSLASGFAKRGEILEVVGLDDEGDPLFGSFSEIGSAFADDVLARASIVEPEAPTFDDEPDSVTLGACYEDPGDGQVVRVVAIDPTLLSRDVDATPGACDTSWSTARAFRSIFTRRVADPTPAVVDDALPAALDRVADFAAKIVDDAKPRGVKPALALIPWECMPDRLRSEIVRESTHPERVIEILFDVEGDDFANDVARAFEHGAEKYGIDNWRGIEWTPKASLEYRSAMLRHLYADAIGEPTDPDSGVSHRAHACASAMIHLYHERRAAERAEKA